MRYLTLKKILAKILILWVQAPHFLGLKAPYLKIGKKDFLTGEKQVQSAAGGGM